MPKKNEQQCELTINGFRLVLPVSKGLAAIDALKDAVEVVPAGYAVGHPELNLQVLPGGME